MNLRGAVAVVSGASSGIGAATAVLLSRSGASAVALLARSREALEVVASQVRQNGAEARVYVADLSQLDAIAELGERISRELGAPNVLVNNAGAGRWLFTEETSVSEANSMMTVPYGCAFGLTRAFLPSMLARRSGHIVNLSSPACFMSWPGATAYAAARWAMRGFSEALEADLHGTGVDVSLVVPGKVSTEYFANNPGSEQRIPKLASWYRTLGANEVAAMVIDAIEHRRRLVIRPPLLAMSVLWARWFPASVRWLLVQSGARRAQLERP
ncbi:MAG: SDR family NAD(P)-dependent oxidoreductase [Myxococcota bacterium]